MDHTTPPSKEAMQKCPGDSPKPPSLMDIKTYNDVGPITKKSRDDFIRCNECKITLSPGEDAEQHFSGVEHARRLEMLNKSRNERTLAYRWQDDRLIDIHPPQDHSTPSVASQFRTNIPDVAANSTIDNNSPAYPDSRVRDRPSHPPREHRPDAKHDKYDDSSYRGYEASQNNSAENQSFSNNSKHVQNDTNDNQGSFNCPRPQNYPTKNQSHARAEIPENTRLTQNYPKDNQSDRNQDLGENNRRTQDYHGSFNNHRFQTDGQRYPDARYAQGYTITDNRSSYCKTDNGPPNKNFDKQLQNYDERPRTYQNYHNPNDQEPPRQYREGNHPTELSRNGESSRCGESSKNRESEDFDSSQKVAEKRKESHALKNFYGSSLESYFNPPENDFIIRLPDEEGCSDYYDNLAEAEAEASKTKASEKEDDGLTVEDFWNDPPDNLLGSHKDSDDADHTVDDYTTSHEEPVQHKENDNDPYFDNSQENAQAVESTYDNNGQLNRSSYTRDTRVDGSPDENSRGNRYSNSYYGSEQRNKSSNSYTDNDYNTTYTNDYNNHGNNNSSYDEGYHEGYHDNGKDYNASDERNRTTHNTFSSDTTQMKEQANGT